MITTERKEMISIEVHGGANSGKSSIAELIRLALELHGVKARVSDFCGIGPMIEESPVPDIQKTMPVLAERLDVVSIVCIQTPRVRYITSLEEEVSQ